jgi:tetratricopeptide (TPR) repeat protein
MLSFLKTRRWVWLLLTTALLLVTALSAVNLWAWYHFRAAQQALHDDQIELAYEHVIQCLRVWSGAQTHLLAARIERLRGNTAEVERHLQECNRQQHGSSEAVEIEALLLQAQTGTLHRVEDLLWRCVESNQAERVWILESLARIHIRDSRLGTALRCLNRWLELEPGVARAWHWRGWIQERFQEPEKAIADYQRALELDPARWGARLRLARVYLDQHDAAKARPHVDELNCTHAEEAGVLIAVAQCRKMQGQEKDALEIVDRLLAVQPGNFDARSLRGQLTYQLGSLAEAEMWLRKALVERPEDVPTLHTLAECLKDEGKAKEAAEVQARHKRAQNDALRLTELLNREIERSPHNPDLLGEVGAILLRQGDEQAGLQWLYRALRENPNHTPTHDILMRHFESRKDMANAEKHRRYLAGGQASSRSGMLEKE